MASVSERIPRIRVCVKQDGQGIIVKQVQKPFWNQKTLNNTMFNQLLEVALYFVTELEGCRNVSCLNGGTCNSSFGNFSCVCPLGYWGEFCELGMISKHTLFTVYDHAIIPFHKWWEKFSFFVTDVDECEISPCWNNGTCVNLFGGYQCNCSDDFEGDQCETGWIRLHIKAEIKSKFKQTCISRNIKTVVFDTSFTLAYICWFICVTFAVTY